MRYVELRRHTDNDGDRLSEQGVADAEAIGRTGLHPPYAAFVVDRKPRVGPNRSGIDLAAHTASTVGIAGEHACGQAELGRVSPVDGTCSSLKTSNVATGPKVSCWIIGALRSTTSIRLGR
jgi:hypothetical protein